MKEESEYIRHENEEFADKINFHYKKANGEIVFMKSFIAQMKNEYPFERLQVEANVERSKRKNKILLMIIFAIVSISALFFLKKCPSPQPPKIIKNLSIGIFEPLSVEQSKLISDTIIKIYGDNLKLIVNDSKSFNNKLIQVDSQYARDSLIKIFSSSLNADYYEANKIFINSFSSCSDSSKLLFVGNIPMPSARELQYIEEKNSTENPIVNIDDWNLLASKKEIELVWLVPKKMNMITDGFVLQSKELQKSNFRVLTINY